MTEPDYKGVEKTLVTEIGLTASEARVFITVTTGGMMSADGVSARLGIRADDALSACRRLVALGGFIDMSDGPDSPRFEAMHPRFTAVNMYRRMCERNNTEFGRNKAVDAVGAVLEDVYDDARTR